MIKNKLDKQKRIHNKALEEVKNVENAFLSLKTFN